MAIGIISIIAGVSKVAIAFPTSHSLNTVWSWKQNTTITTIVEQFTAVVACCLPAFRVYLQRAKSKAVALVAGGGGGMGSGPRFRNPGAMDLASQQSTARILADRDQEKLSESNSEARTPEVGH